MFEDVDEGHLDGETPVHYYYNREERLSKAPKIVQDYYDGKMKPLRGFKVLFKNKSNLSILIALIFFVAFSWIYTGINNSRNYAKISDKEFEIQAFSYEEDIYTSIKISDAKKSSGRKRLQLIKPKKDTSETDNSVSQESENSKNMAVLDLFFIDKDKQLIHQETQNVLLDDEADYFKTKTTDYDIMRVDVIISYDGKEKEISAIIKR